ATFNYSGCISIDGDLMREAGLREFQKVEIYNISNGNRFTTYAVAGTEGSGKIVIDGAAAPSVSENDKIIIAAYALLDERELNSLNSTILLMNDDNTIDKVITGKL
ncbi:MAG: aspartate 1-decarboxylase, partial [bacterium]|nr:aspartate 1-decarboxylase [bacterium]